MDDVILFIIIAQFVLMFIMLIVFVGYRSIIKDLLNENKYLNSDLRSEIRSSLSADDILFELQNNPQIGTLAVTKIKRHFETDWS